MDCRLIHAGQLLFDGVPVDVTTSANEDLVIVPGEGGNTQVGDLTGTNSHATPNDDLHLTGILETDGAAYFDSTLTVVGASVFNGTVTLGDASSDDITITGYLASSVIPTTDSTYDLGSSSLSWANLYVDSIKGYNADLALQPASSYSLTGAVTKNTATGNEVAYDLAATINKATSGNYTGLKLNITETAAPGSADKLLDLLVGDTSRLQVYNGTNSANYGLLSVGPATWDGSTSGYFAGSSSGTLIAGNAASGFAGNLLDLQIAGTSVFKVDANGNVTQTGTTTSVGNLDMQNYLILNIGNASTDFTSGGGLTLAGALAANGSTTLGDASGDSLTINAATLSLANASTLNLANSSTTSLNIESGLLDLDTSNSRVGIGTTAPSALLDLESSGSSDGIDINNTASDGDPRLTFQLSGTSTFTMGIDDGDSDKFKIGTSAIDTSTRLTIQSDGNVGIGTTSPSALLHLNGTAAIFGVGEAGSPTATTLRGAAASGTDIAGANLTFDASNGTGTGGSGAFVFRTAPAGSTGTTANTFSERMRVMNTGNVGIGTSSAVGILDARGG